MARSIPDDLGEPIPYDANFKGPNKNRSCTDIICLLLFLCFIGCWVGIAAYAFTSGDPNILLVPKDSYGGRCGLDEHLKDKPYLFFFDLTKCLGPFVPFTGCPTKQICVETCPTEVFKYENPSDVNKHRFICTYNAQEQLRPDTIDSFIQSGECASWYLPSDSFLNRCLPNKVDDRKSLTEYKDIGKVDNDEISQIKKHLNKIALYLTIFVQNLVGFFSDNDYYNKVGQNIVDDLISSWWQILIGVGVAVLICILYIVIMRWLATPMVWLSLIGVVVLLGAAVYFTAVKYIDLKNNPVEEENRNIFEDYATKKDTWLVLLIISSVVLAIVLLILIFLRKRILLAIALIREGSKAVSTVTSALFFPIFPWFFQIIVTAFAIAVALYLATTGEPSYKIRGMNDECLCQFTNGQDCKPSEFLNAFQSCTDLSCKNVTCKFIQMNNTSLYPYLQTFNVFAFLWGTFFVSALGQMILAMVFATWYWTWDKSRVPFFAVMGASLTTVRYHIGTLAFGSLIITICRMIRICLEYVDRKLKKYDNEITKAILCCCKCFFWCLEKFLKFINRNAYIMCAIHGKNFCGSAKDAFMLLMRNILRVFVLDKVTDFLFFLGKLFITVGVGALSYLFFATDLTGFDNSGLNYHIVPVIVIMIITFFVATMFFNVYSMAVDTLFLCFLEDCERNDGSSDKPYFMSKNLMKIFGKKNKLH